MITDALERGKQYFRTFFLQLLRVLDSQFIFCPENYFVKAMEDARASQESMS
jgi:hypothetical protein